MLAFNYDIIYSLFPRNYNNFFQRSFLFKCIIFISTFNKMKLLPLISNAHQKRKVSSFQNSLDRWIYNLQIKSIDSYSCLPEAQSHISKSEKQGRCLKKWSNIIKIKTPRKTHNVVRATNVFPLARKRLIS